jgi:hypothetical protein
MLRAAAAAGTPCKDRNSVAAGASRRSSESNRCVCIPRFAGGASRTSGRGCSHSPAAGGAAKTTTTTGHGGGAAGVASVTATASSSLHPDSGYTQHQWQCGTCCASATTPHAWRARHRSIYFHGGARRGFKVGAGELQLTWLSSLRCLRVHRHQRSS